MISLVCIVLLFFSGCSLWVPVGGPYSSTDLAFEAELPAGWRRAYSTSDGLTLTRDGLPLQILRIVREPFDKDLPFTERKLDKQMLPQEVAEVILDNIRSNQTISNVQVVSNEPAKVGGYAGFKIVFTYQTKENLKKQGVYYGALVDQWYYRVLFEAPVRHYFPREVEVLERIKNSFKITL